jgi:hypothetical protein
VSAWWSSLLVGRAIPGIPIAWMSQRLTKPTKAWGTGPGGLPAAVGRAGAVMGAFDVRSGTPQVYRWCISTKNRFAGGSENDADVASRPVVEAIAIVRRRIAGNASHRSPPSHLHSECAVVVPFHQGPPETLSRPRDGKNRRFVPRGQLGSGKRAILSPEWALRSADGGRVT